LTGFEKGGAMVGNFNISVNCVGDHVHLKMNGDFGGSSACELVSLTNNGGLPNTSQMMVNKDCLKHIFPFGLDVLSNGLLTIKSKKLPLIFTGKSSTQFPSGD
jgi:hypothetical protein